MEIWHNVIVFLLLTRLMIVKKLNWHIYSRSIFFFFYICIILIHLFYSLFYYLRKRSTSKEVGDELLSGIWNSSSYGKVDQLFVIPEERLGKCLHAQSKLDLCPSALGHEGWGNNHQLLYISQCQQMTRNFPIPAFSWKRKENGPGRSSLWYTNH